MKSKNERRQAFLFTLFWMASLTIWGLYLHAHEGTKIISYESYSKVKFVLSVPFLGSALCCLWAYSSKNLFQEKSASLRSWGVHGLIFWVLFPPAWFLADYYGSASGVFAHADKGEVKEYADLASKMWAGFLALYAFTINQRIKVRDKELERKETESGPAKGISKTDEDAPEDLGLISNE
jgi:hypothetical protein